MPQYSVLIRSVTPEKFTEILGASARQAREVYFHRHNIRAPKSRGLPKAGAKNEFRAAELLRVLRERDDEELAEEVLRTWLLTKRAMLAAALDHLNIPHDNGLTDSDDVSRIEKLPSDELKALYQSLVAQSPKDDASLYLRFMGAQIDPSW